MFTQSPVSEALLLGKTFAALLKHAETGCSTCYSENFPHRSSETWK